MLLRGTLSFPSVPTHLREKILEIQHCLLYFLTTLSRLFRNLPASFQTGSLDRQLYKWPRIMWDVTHCYWDKDILKFGQRLQIRQGPRPFNSLALYLGSDWVNWVTPRIYLSFWNSAIIRLPEWSYTQHMQTALVITRFYLLCIHAQQGLSE